MSSKAINICENCGMPFHRKEITQRFCGIDCYKTFRKHGNDDIETECKTCGKKFKTHSLRPRIYCCRRCYDQERATEERKAYMSHTKPIRDMTKEVVDIAAEARALGLSYGQYVALKEMRKNANGCRRVACNR